MAYYLIEYEKLITELTDLSIPNHLVHLEKRLNELSEENTVFLNIPPQIIRKMLNKITFTQKRISILRKLIGHMSIPREEVQQAVKECFPEASSIQMKTINQMLTYDAGEAFIYLKKFKYHISNNFYNFTTFEKVTETNITTTENIITQPAATQYGNLLFLHNTTITLTPDDLISITVIQADNSKVSIPERYKQTINFISDNSSKVIYY